MPRKRLTQVFPFLLPLRRWQRKQLFYLKMALDRNCYAKSHCAGLLPHTVFESGASMVNEHSGFPIEYQYNKVHNLRLAARPLNHLIIRPGETFSFCRCTRHADRETPYKDGLVLQNGEITGAYGGGLCQLSNLLFWMFLHTPLTIVERHGHGVKDFPEPPSDAPAGVDATVAEGWLDLRVRNDTTASFQIAVAFEEGRIIGRVLTDREPGPTYQVIGEGLRYTREGDAVFEEVDILRCTVDKATGLFLSAERLYRNRCRIGYPLPAGTPIATKEEEK